MSKTSSTLFALGLFLVESVFLFAEVIPEGRRTAWQGNVGVPGGIPNRTDIHTTLSPGVSAAQISDAINSCPPGKVVRLSAGTFDLGAGQIRVLSRNNWTLRGAGMGQTILKSTNGNNVIAIGNAPWLSQWPATHPIVSGATKGSTAINISGGTAGINLSELIWIEQPNSGTVFGQGVGGSGAATPFPGVHRMNDVNAVLGCRAFVTAINGSTVTFTPPLPFDFDGSPRVVGYGGMDGPVMSGIEDLTVNGSSGDGNGILLQAVYAFWLKNVEVTNFDKVGIACWWSCNMELRGCYIHDPHVFNWSRGYGLELNSVNHVLVEDNIFYRNQGHTFIQGTSVANVLAYNCAFRIYPVYPSGIQWQLASFQMNHATHSKMNLWEGNYGNYFQSDFYYGGCSNGTLLRNFVAGFDPDTKENTICISLDSRSWDWNVVGNVLGLDSAPFGTLTLQKPGATMEWAMPAGTVPWAFGTTSRDSFGYSARRIFRLGYPYSGQNSFAGIANPPAVGGQYNFLDISLQPGGGHATLIHGNWDAANDAQTWDPAISDRNIPNSYYLAGRPSWFGNLAWPPYDPANPPTNAADALAKIPAGYRLLYNAKPPTGEDDSSPPTAPTGLSAVAGGINQINLNWTVSTDNVGVASYRIERSHGTGAASYNQIAIAVSSSFVDVNLAGGASYTYRVCAMDVAGNQSSYSNEVTAIAASGPDTTAPTSPANFNAIGVGAAQVNLSWSPSSDNIGVTGYQIERAQGVGSATYASVATVAAVAFVDIGLSPGTAYNYRIRAIDSAGNLSDPFIIPGVSTGVARADGLVAAFGFNESNGAPVTDSSGNGHTGMITGAVRTSQGKFGGALSFNGVSDVVTVANSALLNFPSGMTLEAWVYPTANQNSWRAILHKEKDAYYLHGSSPDGAMRPAGGAIFDGREQYSATNSPIPTNTWTHLATTYDGTAIKLYVNGVAVATRSLAGATEANGKPLRIGGNSYSDQFFKGIIDEVRIYGRSLSQSEIQADMNAPVGSPPPPAPSGLKILPAAQ